MRKLLTVVIPTYNTERLLAKCLESLLACRLAEYTELLVVDDGSTDRSGEIAEDYAKRYPQIVKVIHKANGGHGSAINMGIGLATGTYFKVVDSDDAVELAAYEDFLQKLNELQPQHCDLIATPFTCMWNKTRTRLAKTRLHPIEGAEFFPEGKLLPFETVASRLYVRMHEWTIRTSILKEHSIRMSEHCFYVDMQYILFPIPWIRTCCILDLPVYCYRLGDEGQSISVGNMQKNRRQHQRVMHSLVAFYKQRMLAGDSKKRLAYLAKGIAKMEANQVQTILSLPIGKKAKKELLKTEQWIKQECSAAYAANEKKSLQMLRKSRYMLYPAAAMAWRVVKFCGVH